MALREIRETGDPVLNKISKKVKEMTPRTAELIEDMYDTMREANGVGLAAPQVGILKRIVVMEVEEGETYTLINPEIKEQDGEQTGYEGCLSVPGMTGIVTRPEHVVCEALNEKMEPYTIDAHGLLARCICHELEHLDGHLYPEIAEEMMTNEELERREAEMKEQEEQE
ncbi:MAG: peptide deformylase [Stomatobaculum sp.]|nr:peptide deformylase [Stomatobaculum sp.]